MARRDVLLGFGPPRTTAHGYQAPVRLLRTPNNFKIADRFMSVSRRMRGREMDINRREAGEEEEMQNNGVRTHG